MTREQIIKITKSLKLEADETTILDMLESANKLLEKLEKLKQIDTASVTPMVRVDDTPISFLREDIVKPGLTKEQVLSSAPKVSGNFIVVENKGISSD